MTRAFLQAASAALLLLATVAQAQPAPASSLISSARERANPPSLASVASPICPGLVGDAALACVADAYRPASLLSLAESKDRLYDTVDRTSRDGQDGVAGFYTGHFVPFDCAPSCDPSQDVYNGDGSDGINQEHLWPRAAGADGNDAERDLHHLVPTRAGVNSSRGSLPFADVPDPSATRWYVLDLSQPTAPPTGDRDRWSERQGATAWEPREVAKGDAARALFYVAAVYADLVDPAWFEPQVPTLLAWHEADPPSASDRDRSDRVALFQTGCASGACVNPFVADPTLAARAFGEAPAPAVALGSLSASPTERGARVEWTTIEEVGIDRFLVDGRPDAFGQPFVRWGEVAATGAPSSYELTLDEAPGGGPLLPGRYRVRLLATTATGNVLDLGDVGLEVTTPTSADEPAASGGLAPVAPNPATSGLVQTVLTLTRPAHVLAVVTDALGREVAVVHDGPATGRLAVAVDTSGFAPGVYRLRIEPLDGQTVQSRPFTVAE